MRNLRVLLYGDVDLNIMDGSAVWLTSVANMLTKDKNIRVDILLKAPIKQKHLISSVLDNPQINIINTFEIYKDRMFNNRNRMDIEEASNLMTELNEEKNYHFLIVRGFNLVKTILNSSLAYKTIPYITDFTHDVDRVSYEEREDLKEIYRKFPNMFVQTPEMGDLLKQILSVDGKKLHVLPPMIPDIDKIPEFENINSSLVYTGKFAEQWYFNEMLDCFDIVRERDSVINLNIAGDKFQGDLANNKENHIKRLKETNGVNWVGAISRRHSQEFIENSDIGICWRSEEIDNDLSVELSTKLLEFGINGKPVLLRRTKLHENLLGKDYPLFIEDSNEFVNKVLEAIYNPKLYRVASKRAFEASKNHTFTEVYKSLKEMLWSFNQDKVKLLFAGHDLKFIKMTMDYFENQPNFEIKVDKWDGHNKHNEAYSKECLDWADIIFCEWGLGNAVWYSQNKKEGQKLFVRMHLQEKNTEHPSKFNIDKIDKIIAISPYIYEEFYRVCKIPREKMTMIFNLVDTEKFNKPKKSNTNIKYNIGICGILPSRKRMDIAVNILEKLWKEDKRYKLFVKSKLPSDLPWLKNRPEEMQYYDDLFERINKAPWAKNIIFDPPGDDMDQWFTKIGYILSTSDFESFHLAPMEGMASGSTPLVIHWPGADTIYPKEYLFNDEDQITSYIKSGKFGTNIQEYPKNMFDKNIINEKIKTLLLS